MFIPREVRDALDRHDVCDEIRAVLEEAADELEITGATQADGRLGISVLGFGSVAAMVDSDTVQLALDPDLAKQVSSEVGWTITRRTAAGYQLLIRAEELLGPTAQALAANLFAQALASSRLTPPPAPARAARAPRATKVAGTPRAPTAAPRVTRAPAKPERPSLPACPTCFSEMLGGHCANCE